jgi:uncharacterized protein YnzC (UPF0291/DUF896 family)
MARPRKKQAEGLGDTVENILEVTGIAKVAKWVLGEDCGCEERKAKLNELWRYTKPECLTEDEYKYLDEFFTNLKSSVSPNQQRELLKIYNRVFKQRMQPTSCGSCVREIVNKLNKLYAIYKEENATTEAES